MTVSSDFKKELMQFPANRETLLALIRMNGSLQLAKEPILSISTGSAAIAQYIYKLFWQIYQIKADTKREILKNIHRGVYRLYVQEESQRILEDLDLTGSFLLEQGLPDAVKFDKKKQVAYLRGALLAAGTLSNPRMSHYQLTIASVHEAHARDLVSLLKKLGITAQEGKQRDRYLVRLTSVQSISSFLGVVEAKETLRAFQEASHLRKIRGLANRQANFESANITKTVVAAQEMIEQIEWLKKQNRLPLELKEIAEIRLKNPEATLLELGQMLEPPLGKSGVAHRLRKLNQLME